MIKTVLFDLGNVILPFDLTCLANQLARYTNFSPEIILEKIAYNQVAVDFETGKMTPKEYFDFVTKACDFKDLSYTQFIVIFNDIFDQDHQVWDLISRLKKNYKLGLISNTNPIHVDYIRSNHPQLDHFHHLWFSNEAGLRKPDHAIFKLALTHFDADPAETVFIDDYEENIIGALELGIKALHYKGFDKLKTDLHELGVQH